MIALTLMTVGCASLSHRTPRPAFVPGLYQQEDGAITLHDDGLMVEPYFATKALLAARQAGLDIDVAGGRWAAWAMQRQRDDGSFDRWCRDSLGTGWRACGEADADDALLALWVELLHRLAPGRSLPVRWPASARAAEARLATLRDRATGLYHISETKRTALFMDNVEIYGALRGIADMERALGANTRAVTRQALADSLGSAIDRDFWRAERGEYAISTQPTDGSTFYPFVVAQVYPWLDSLPPPSRGARPTFASWFARYGDRWLSASGDEYPWGLVALAAVRSGDDSIARRWLSSAAAFRRGPRWNVLEEAIFQALSARFSTSDAGARLEPQRHAEGRRGGAEGTSDNFLDNALRVSAPLRDSPRFKLGQSLPFRRSHSQSNVARHAHTHRRRSRRVTRDHR